MALPCDPTPNLGSQTRIHERSDAELVEAVLGGEVEAYAVLVQRYRDVFTRFAVRMLGNRDDADDALQRAFLRGYKALPHCDGARFGGWMYTIVLNQCRTFARLRGKRERRFVYDEEIPLQTSREIALDETTALRSEIEHALAKLDVEYREAFILKHVEGMSYEEMTELTGAGISALKMRVKRACEKLQGLLKEVYYV